MERAAMTYEMEIEQGLSFARAQLAKRLTDPESDPARVADIALATLALVAARDAWKREPPAILKTNAFMEPCSRVPHAPYDDSAPATIRFEEAVAALSQRNVPKTRREERVPSGTPCLKLYREE
jgi:hypothetical protein